MTLKENVQRKQSFRLNTYLVRKGEVFREKQSERKEKKKIQKENKLEWYQNFKEKY